MKMMEFDLQPKGLVVVRVNTTSLLILPLAHGKKD